MKTGPEAFRRGDQSKDRRGEMEWRSWASRRQDAGMSEKKEVRKALAVDVASIGHDESVKYSKKNLAQSAI